MFERGIAVSSLLHQSPFFSLSKAYCVVRVSIVLHKVCRVSVLLSYLVIC